MRIALCTLPALVLSACSSASCGTMDEPGAHERDMVAGLRAE